MPQPPGVGMCLLAPLLQRVCAAIKAGKGTRTLDIQLGKLTLYQLSYARSGDAV